MLSGGVRDSCSGVRQSGNAVFVFLVVAAAVAMAGDRVHWDVVAVLVVLAPMLSGVLPVGRALSWTGSQAVTLLVQPGRDRSTDRLELGLPLPMPTYLVTLLAAPLMFTFDAP